jgi:hypothetical protein
VFSDLMFLRELQPGSAAHSVAATLRCRGEFDSLALGLAADEVAAQRVWVPAAVLSSGRVPGRLNGRASRVCPREHDATGLDDGQLTAWLDYAAHEPFDLKRGPLLRIHLYRTPAPGTVVLVVAHHLITDFWSMATLVRDLERLYSELTGGKPEPLPELTDFVRHYCWVSASRVSAYAALNPQSDFLRRLR